MEGLHALGESKILALAMRKPTPVLEGGILFKWHWNAVRQVEAGKTLPIGSLRGGFSNGRKGLKPRKGQGDTRTP